MSLNPTRDRYERINKRNFRSAIINLLENEYKIMGSRKILEILADDIENLHREYYPKQEQPKMMDNARVTERRRKITEQQQ